MKWWIFPLAISLAGSAQAASWVIKPDGLGPYKVGARYENLGKTFGGLEADKDITLDKVCRVARSKRYPRLEVTFVRKTVVRVDVAGGYGTERGVRIGDPASKLQRVYGDAVKPHPEHADWLMVETGDRELAIRYMMQGGKVTAIHAGKRLQLQTLEGCK
ncbi:hypothetical protein SAMN05518865_114146 [Duganella sp. CF458]|uniref:hypothetical protein n=1 Tax=Duganella sp. CF458 TaxID=1884368 RepID=UPI0008E0081B|nr:hypothetical protein [Duganella sp. CF458]SFG60209.1 hypothetical protein SAMN05518865_114146 [Duganella sp. CF458]